MKDGTEETLSLRSDQVRTARYLSSLIERVWWILVNRTLSSALQDPGVRRETLRTAEKFAMGVRDGDRIWALAINGGGGN